MSWRTAWLREAAELEGVEAQWAALAGDAPPWDQATWFLQWWRAFGTGRPAVLTVWDGDELAAVMAMSSGRRRLRAMANAHTPAFRPIARDHEALERLAAAAVRAAPFLELHALALGADAHCALRGAAAAAGRLILTEEQYASPVTETTGDFAGYRARMRRGWVELERRGRKLAREHEVELVLADADANADLEAGLRLESAGWKATSGTAILSSPRTAAFYRAVAADAAHRGTLRCSSLRVDGELAAFDLAMVAGGRYLLLKTTYAEGMRALSPGLVLRRAVIERCFGLGLEAHEFLGADAPWKRLFATGSRRHGVVRFYAARPLPGAAFAYRRALRPRVRRLALRAGYRPGMIARSE